MLDLCDEDVLPWMICGDFNEIIHADEKQDGKRQSENQMRGFREVVRYAVLIDLGFVGSKFTWSNKFTKIRLDRAFATSFWSDIFPQTRVNVLPLSVSDHAPLLVQLHLSQEESYWSQHAKVHWLKEAGIIDQSALDATLVAIQSCVK
ncbi:hypothetical protein M0R45_001378 [Rubus argutus]|uniref:Endonuclease/exonuclease/phosphatase domain-containing protein n=1 Tax=Rubus argutus TaxID=59490 RepID=A0AAW1VN49_RUBAR